LVLAEDRGRLAADYRRAVATGEEFPAAFRIQGRDGQIHWLESYGAIQRDTDGGLVGITGVLRDVTERRKLEQALTHLADQERRRMGHELHDGLAQELIGLGFLTAALNNELQGPATRAAGLAQDIAQALQHAIDSVRKIAKGLVPVEIDAEGLMAALEQLAENSQKRYTIPCRFCCRRPVAVEDNHIATQLYRVAQEAVSNAARHACAQHIEIELASQRGAVVLSIRDDGAGLPVDVNQADGMGLRIMRHRADLIGAELHVATTDRGGTDVVCRLPRSRVEKSLSR
jgi:signal transduction histidine kinase